MSRPFSFLIACALSLSGAFAQVNPVLTIRFDDGFDGVGRKGPVAATVVGKPELASGKFGKAMKSGPTFGQITFPTEGLVRRSGGTVEMWVCPLDWEPGDGRFHVLFETAGTGALYLYKYWASPNLLMLTCPTVQGPYSSAQAPVGEWKPGEWHHVAGTWGPRGVQAYVDGKPAGKLAVEGDLPAEVGKTFTIGDLQWQFPRTTASLVDEVRLYDRPLTPAHIAAHFAGNEAFSY